MTNDKNDNSPQGKKQIGKFRIVSRVCGYFNGREVVNGDFSRPIVITRLYTTYWTATGKVVTAGSWMQCMLLIIRILAEWKRTKGKPYQWQFTDPMQYYAAMEDYLNKQRQQIAAEQQTKTNQ